MEYKPEGVHIIIRGKYAGKRKSAEWLVFNDYPHFLELLQETSQGTRNEMQLHLEWLSRKIKSMPIRMMCPQCRTKPASLLLMQNGFPVHTHTCCSNESCKEKLLEKSKSREIIFLPIEFPLLEKFTKAKDRPILASFFKSCFMLPELLNEEVLFNFFHT
jgi:hypothetical protein